jgi:hypothetical protein
VNWLRFRCNASRRAPSRGRCRSVDMLQVIYNFTPHCRDVTNNAKRLDRAYAREEMLVMVQPVRMLLVKVMSRGVVVPGLLSWFRRWPNLDSGVGIRWVLADCGYQIGAIPPVSTRPTGEIDGGVRNWLLVDWRCAERRHISGKHANAVRYPAGHYLEANHPRPPIVIVFRHIGGRMRQSAMTPQP